MDYKIAEAKSKYGLVEEVRKLIALGYVPQGGVCNSIQGIGDYYYQAMIKQPPKED